MKTIEINYRMEPELMSETYTVIDNDIINKLLSLHDIESLDKYLFDVVMPWHSTITDNKYADNFMFTDSICYTIDILITQIYEESCFTYRLCSYNNINNVLKPITTHYEPIENIKGDRVVWYWTDNELCQQ